MKVEMPAGQIGQQIRAIMIALAVALFFKVTGCAVAHGASSQFGATSEHHKSASSALGEGARELELAKQRHAQRYVGSLTLSSESESLAAAKKLLDQAYANPDPDVKLELTGQAEAAILASQKGVSSQSGLFRELDAALNGYRSEQGSLAALCADSSRQISHLIGRGYFASHFQRQNETILESLAVHRQSERVALAFIDSEKRLPDYVRIYRMCKQAKPQVDAARREALDVPLQRDRAQAQVDRAKQRLFLAREYYPRALEAARYLERYPRYDCIQSVNSSFAALTGIEDEIRIADGENSMQRQLFGSAAQRAETSLDRIREVDAAFIGAVRSRDSVRSAIRNIPSAKSEALSELNGALRHIRNNGQNYQGRAKSYASNARSLINSANSLADSDPPRALSQYEEAESEARSAYSAVDTSTPSDDDDDSSFGSSTSGSGSIFGGSSSSSRRSSSSSSSSSSRRSSSSSSSSSSAPRGGGAGGPRGGGAGGGGL